MSEQERIARMRKAYRLADGLEAYARDSGIVLDEPADIEGFRVMEEAGWKAVIKRAGIRNPSGETIKQALGYLAERIATRHEDPFVGLS